MMEDMLDKNYEEEVKTPNTADELEEKLLDEVNIDDLSSDEGALQLGLMGTYQRVYLQNQLL